MIVRDLLSRLLNPRADLSRLEKEHAPYRRPEKVADEPEKEMSGERPAQMRRVRCNLPLLVGGLIVFVLFLGVLFGALLAPQNPYLHGRQRVQYVDGELSAPPFPPSAEYPLGTDQLGRDILSMLLYGTRNTLVAAACITMGRLALGLVLGGVAGWNEGRPVDRLVMGAVQLLISLPMLLVAMILIFALDIRKGLPVFIAALCAIGWGEIAQYVRAEFIRIKPEPYLDSGRAIGLTPLELAVRHVLPNVLPALIVITLLEMGAVLMILGELGFIGVYIGGGSALIEGDVRRVRHFTLPEWGAMMAYSRAFARSYPWMVIYTALAFFISVTGFNLLGEGLRRAISRGRFNTGLLLSWRTFAGAGVITLASVYVILTLGPAPSYRNLARQVSEMELRRHVAALSGPEMRGRGPGTEEALRAAEYIAGALETYEVAPPPGGFLKQVTLTMVHPLEAPELAVVDESGERVKVFTRLVDYAESTEHHGGSGEAEAPVTLVLFPAPVAGHVPGDLYHRFKGLNLEGQIALLLEGNAPEDFITEALIRGAAGVLLVSEDVRPRHEIASHDSPPQPYLESPALPVLRLHPRAADVLLSNDGWDLERAREQVATLDFAERAWEAHPLTVRMRMEVALSEPEEVTFHNVLWLVEGTDAAMQNDLVIVSCHYDGLGVGPDGTLYPGANANASGVAALLEITRLWQGQDFQPRRSVLFAAWGGGELPYSGAHFYADQPSGFIHSYDVSGVLHLDRLGTPEGKGLVIQNRGPRENLRALLESSARRLDVEVRSGGAVRYGYQRRFDGYLGTLVVTWGDPAPAFAADRPEAIDAGHLNRATQVVNLTLITAAQEPRY
ncbi:MAG: ABC transporter permease subunit [Anaerolineales bacterium]